MTVVRVSFRQRYLLVALHDVHQEVLSHGLKGKGWIPGRIRLRIRIARRRARHMKLADRGAASFKLNKIRYIIWPERLLANLSDFLSAAPPQGRG